MVVLAGGYLLYVAATDKRTPLDRAHPALPVAVVAALAAACVWACCRLHRCAGGAWGGLAREYRPLLLVYASILGILVAGTLLGSTGFNLIILIHVTAWLVFVQYQLGRRPPVRTRNVWTWLRATPAGFLTLHLGIALVVLVLMAIRVHLWHRVGFVSELLASCNFCYWGLMHISMSFWSSR
jgi:hypothetical protein